MGYGHVAEYGHLPAIAEVPDLQLVSVYDPDPVRIDRVGDRYGIGQRFTDSDAFFESGIDAWSSRRRRRRTSRTSSTPPATGSTCCARSRWR
jgi:hypothetical protein